MAVKGVQTVPQRTITQANLVESVQLLYDLLGASKLGRDGASVWVCGVKLEPPKQNTKEESDD